MSYSNIKSSNEVFAPMPESIKLDFIKLLKVQSNADNESHMLLFITDYLRSKNISFYIDDIGNIIAEKGDAEIKPCIVSHIDTVHKFVKNFKVYSKIDKVDKHEILYNKTGIGGDDKNGIFACFYMLERFENIKVVFFTSEEVGLIGSSNIDLKIFDNVGYILQLDRWGYNDFICKYYDEYTVNVDFLEVFTSLNYGYEIASGLITDSINLFNQNVGVSCVNISCGYYAHHSKNEYIDLNQFYNSLLFTENLIQSLGNNSYEVANNDYEYEYESDDNNFSEFEQYLFNQGYSYEQYEQMEIWEQTFLDNDYYTNLKF